MCFLNNLTLNFFSYISYFLQKRYFDQSVFPFTSEPIQKSFLMFYYNAIHIDT